MLFRPAFLSAAIGAMLIVGCAKRVAQAPPTPPLPAPPPAVATTETRPQPAAQQPARPATASNTTASTNMSQQERADLQKSLAHLEDALFDYDKTSIRTDAATVLKEDVSVIRTTLQKYPKEQIRLEGHADERGSAEYNLGLGDRRAESVKEFLVTMGVPAGQLSTVSYGKERPQCTDENEACYQKNRRVHLEIASN